MTRLHCRTSLCSCLRTEISQEHWDLIKTHSSSFRQVAYHPALVQGDIKKLPRSHPSYEEGTPHYALFASKWLSQGDYIGEYTGVFKYDTGNVASPYSIQVKMGEVDVGFGLVIDSDKKGNEMRYIQHASTPTEANTALETVWCHGYLCVMAFATAEIKRGMEMLLPPLSVPTSAEIIATTSTGDVQQDVEGGGDVVYESGPVQYDVDPNVEDGGGGGDEDKEWSEMNQQFNNDDDDDADAGDYDDN